MNNWEWFGSAGHFCAADSCLFHLTTKVGDYLVSTVGDYYPRGVFGEPETIGLERLFETMVFKCDGVCECGCGMPKFSDLEVDMEGYNTRAEANAGHIKLCEKWGDA